jgi:hypothetical protein
VVLRHTGAGAQTGWVGLKFEAPIAGMRIAWTAGGVKRTRLKTAGGTYLSANDPRELLGLGSANKIDMLEISWPGGKQKRFANVASGRYYTVTRTGDLQR